MSLSKFWKEALGWVASGGPKATGIPYTLATVAIPVIQPPSGSINASGVITLNTAMVVAYANAWIQLPAGAISGGLAGMYFCKFSTNVSGQIYTNYINPNTTAFIPTIPTSLVTAVGAGAYTPALGSDMNSINVTLPAYALGANGSVRVHIKVTVNPTANPHIVNLKLGGVSAMAATLTSTNATSPTLSISNRGVYGSQIGELITSDRTFSTASNFTFPNVDTTISQPIAITSNLNTATDFSVIEAVVIEVLARN